MKPKILNALMGLVALGLLICQGWGIAPLMNVLHQQISDPKLNLDEARGAAMDQLMTAYMWCGRGALVILVLAGVNQWLLRNRRKKDEAAAQA
jgi:hypothetical protein